MMLYPAKPEGLVIGVREAEHAAGPRRKFRPEASPTDTQEDQMPSREVAVPQRRRGRGKEAAEVADVVADLLHPQVRTHVSRAQREYGPDFDPTPLTMLQLINRISATFRTAESYELEAIGLNQTTFNILMVLYRSPRPVTMREVASAISVKPPNLTSAIRDLVGRRLIQRRDNASDNRSYLVEIADRGEALLRPFLPGHFRFIEALFSELTLRERRQLIAILDKLLVSVSTPDGQRGISQLVLAAASHARSSSKSAP